MSNISVIMSVYKEAPQILEQAIESILNQTFRTFEFIIILDNPSNFEAEKIIKKFSNQDNRIIYVKNEMNIGLSKSLNKAILISKYEYIARMDADDISLPTRLEDQLLYMKKNNLDLVGGYIEQITELGDTLIPCLKVPTSYSKIRRKLKFNNCIFHPTWLMKKEIFSFVNGYGLNGVEDYEVLLKIKDKYVMGNIPKVVLKYRMTTNSISRTNLFEQYIKTLYLQKKYFKNLSSSYEDFFKISYNEKKSIKYNTANQVFLNCLSNLRERKYFQFIKNFLYSFILSSMYRKKLFNYFFAFYFI